MPSKNMCSGPYTRQQCGVTATWLSLISGTQLVEGGEKMGLWLREDGSIEPVMFQKAPAPKEVRDITHLYCKDGNCNDPKKCQYL